MPTDENNEMQLYMNIDGKFKEFNPISSDIRIISIDMASKSTMRFEGEIEFKHDYYNEDELAIQLLSNNGLEFAKKRNIDLKKLKDYLLVGGEIDSLKNVNIDLNCYIDMFLWLYRTQINKQLEDK